MYILTVKMDQRQRLLNDVELAQIQLRILPLALDADTGDPKDPILYSTLYWLRNFFENNDRSVVREFKDDFLSVARRLLIKTYEEDYLEDNEDASFEDFLIEWINLDSEEDHPNGLVSIYESTLEELKTILRMM